MHADFFGEYVIKKTTSCEIEVRRTRRTAKRKWGDIAVSPKGGAAVYWGFSVKTGHRSGFVFDGGGDCGWAMVAGGNARGVRGGDCVGGNVVRGGARR